MKLWITVACSCLAVSAVLAQAAPVQPAPAGISPDDLQKLAKDLETTANKWLESTKYEAKWTPGRLDEQMDNRLAAVVYGEASVPTLKACLKTIPLKKPANIYIINRLLEPLRRAPAGVISEMLPAITELIKKYDFEEVPVWTSIQIRNFKGPDKSPTLAQLDAARKEQDKKLAKEVDIDRYNKQVALLAKNYFALIILANEPKEDEKFIKLISDMESKGSGLFLVAVGELENITDKARAASFLKTDLPALAERIKWEPPKVYVVKDSLQIDRTENSKFLGAPAAPGLRLLQTVNILKKVNNEPALAVPTDAEYAQHLAEAAKKKSK